MQKRGFEQMPVEIGQRPLAFQNELYWRRRKQRSGGCIDVEQAFRDGAAAAYLVATSDGFEVVLGLMAMLAAVGKAGVTSAENRAALAATRTSKS